MIRIKEFKSDELNKYYRRITEHIEITTLWRDLQLKSEAGSNKSEKGYQLIALSMAGRIADILGIDCYKTKAISMCIGGAFPRHGQEGRDLIAEYATENKLNIDVNFIEALAVEDFISDRLFVASDLDMALREYYSPIPTEQLKTTEVAVVRVCQDTIRKIKILERFAAADGGMLLLEISKTLPEDCQRAGRPVESVAISDKIKILPECPEKQMTKAERADMINEIENFVKVYGDEGIYHMFFLP